MQQLPLTRDIVNWWQMINVGLVSLYMKIDYLTDITFSGTGTKNGFGQLQKNSG